MGIDAVSPCAGFMRVERITDKQGVCLITVFIIGSSILIGTGMGAGNDAWLSGVFGLAMSIPVMLIYARISSLFPGKNLFEILRHVLGRFTGHCFMVVYTFYAFHLGALVLRDFSGFIHFSVMYDTPMAVPILSSTLLCILASRSGIEVLGRAAAYALPVLLAIFSLTLILGIFKYEPDYLQPILGNGLSPVLKSGFSAFSFPYAETLLFMGSIGLLKKKDSAYRIYLGGSLLGGIVITLATLRNTLLLGEMCSQAYYPSYTALSLIGIGKFFERFEIAVSFVYITGIFIKGSICLTSACKGLSSIFNLHDYRTVVLPAGLLMSWFAYDMFPNAETMHQWTYLVYQWYALPFQVIIPLLLWLVAEIRVRRGLKV